MPHDITRLKVKREWIDTPFLVRLEMWGDGDNDTLNVDLERYYSFAGEYVGDKQVAYSLHRSGIIHFEKRTPNAQVCTIGFNPIEQKWSGWSHRAIAGFSIGQHVEESEVGWPAHTIATLDEAKQHAKDFAKAVS